MEYFELGDLENYINPQMTEQDAKVITTQLLEGLKILHGYNWAHRDLKPQNIFVVEQAPHWWVKIGDFGISKRVYGELSGMHTMVGTPDYIAPEVFPFLLDDEGNENEDSFQYTVAVDMWSLGCVLFRLLTRQLPFPSTKCLGPYCRSKRSFPTGPLRENGVSEDGIAILLEMMKPYPSDRLTVTAAMVHPWVNPQESTSLKATLLSAGGMGDLPTRKDTKYNFGEEPAIADLRLQPSPSPYQGVDTESIEKDILSQNTVLSPDITRDLPPVKKAEERDELLVRDYSAGMTQAYKGVNDSIIAKDGPNEESAAKGAKRIWADLFTRTSTTAVHRLKGEHPRLKTSATGSSIKSRRYACQSGRWFYCSDENCEYSMNKLFKYASREKCEQHIRMHHNEEPSQFSSKEEEEAQTVKISAPTSTTGSQRYVHQPGMWLYC